MPGCVYFRDDHDITGARVIDNFPVLLLCVESAAVSAHLCLAAMLCEPRPGFDLDPPALVIGEMQMQAVHFVVGDQVYVAFDILEAEEVPCHVEHCPAPDESGRIPYRNGRQADGVVLRPNGVLRSQRRSRWKELAKGLDRVEQSCRTMRAELDLIRCDS